MPRARKRRKKRIKEKVKIIPGEIRRIYVPQKIQIALDDEIEILRNKSESIARYSTRHNRKEQLSKAIEVMDPEEIQKRINSIRTYLASLKMEKEYGFKKESRILYPIKALFRAAGGILNVLIGIPIGRVDLKLYPKEALRRRAVAYGKLAEISDKEMAQHPEYRKWLPVLNVYESELKVAQELSRLKKYFDWVPEEQKEKISKTVPLYTSKMLDAEKNFLEHHSTVWKNIRFLEKIKDEEERNKLVAYMQRELNNAKLNQDKFRKQAREIIATIEQTLQTLQQTKEKKAA